MRVAEDHTPQLFDVFSYIFKAQTDALANGRIDAYFRLVDQLESMTASALNKEEIRNLKKVKRIMRTYIRHLSNQFSGDNNFRNMMKEKKTYETYLMLKNSLVLFPLKKLIAKICISALSKTMMEKIIPKDADFYDFESDLKDELEEIAFNLESYGVKPLRFEEI